MSIEYDFPSRLASRSDAENAVFAAIASLTISYRWVNGRTRQRLVRRTRCGNANHLGQIESVPHYFRNAEMGDVDRIEGAAKYADSHGFTKRL